MKRLLKLLKSKFWEKDDDDLLRYAKLITDHYSWKLQSGNVMDLLAISENLSKQLSDQYYHYLQQCRDARDEIEQLRNSMVRYETEVKHLKDLVQSKNMVIDKLQGKMDSDKPV